MHRLGIIFPNKTSSSETFIKAHVDYLPVEKEILYGGWFPAYYEGDKLLVPPNQPPGIFKRITNRLIKKPQPPENRKHKALLNYLSEHQIDAILAEYGPTGVAVMDVCREARTPLIVHFHGFDAFHSPTLAEYKEKYQKLFKTAKAIVAVSKDMKDQLISLGAPFEKVYYNPYGVDLSRFEPNSSKVNDPVFLFIGRFVNKKAPHLLILAFARVKEIIPNAKLVMGGDGGIGNSGELYTGCKQLVKALKIEDAVDFKGSLSHDQVAYELRMAYAYVQHSVRPDHGDSEGLPNSILEACAAGLPVVATRHAGIKDVISDGINGYLVDEYDIEEMASKMVYLVRNPSVAFQMGEAARKNIVDHYSLDRSIAGLMEIVYD